VSRLLRAIVYNWPLKILAIVLAFLLYAGLVVSQSTFEYPGSLRIDVLNQPTDAVVLGNLPPVTRIRYIVNGDVGAGPTPESWRATIDLAGADPKAGSIYAAVAVTSVDPRFIVIDYEPRGVNVQLDPYKSYTVPVRVDSGTVPDNLDVGTPVLSQPTVTVSGPDSVVRFVVAAQANVVIDAHGLSIDRDVPLVPIDNLGNPRSPVRVDPLTVHVKIDVISNVTAKQLVVNPVVTGTPPAGYVIGTPTVIPAFITVKGDPAALAALTRADTQGIAVGTATGSIDADVSLALPSGVVPVGGDTVHVTIPIKPETGTQSFTAAVLPIGQQPGLSYALSRGSVFATIGGPLADLDRIDPTSFAMTVNVAGLGLGSHELRPVGNLQAGLRVLTVSPETVTVTVTITPSGSPAAGASGP
jgi:YbbR domain-containing protein